jgi:PAS domain S-box-containing protein
MAEGKHTKGTHSYSESIINTVREPLLVLDQNLRVVTVSRSFYDFFKVTPKETVGQLIYDLGNKQWDIPKLRELLETILPQKTSFDDYEVEHDFTTIGKRTMLLNARQIERGSRKELIILLAIEDITERKQIEDILSNSEELYRHVFETASDGILLLEKGTGLIIHSNLGTKTMLGYSREECLGKNLWDIGVSLDTSDFPAIMHCLDRQGILNFDNIPVETRAGVNIFVDIFLVERAKVVQCNIRDVSSRKQKEEDIQRLNRTLLARSHSSQAMIRAEDETWYLNEVCRIIVRDCGHDLVWIGFAQQDEDRTVRPVAHAGLDEGYLDSARITLTDTERDQEPVGTAIRTDKPTIFQNTLDIPSYAPWQEETVKRGFAAVIGVPLMEKGEAFGSLNIYSKHQNLFSEDEVQLLSALAADLSYGIGAIRQRITQEEMELALRQSEERYRNLFDNMLEGVAYCKMLYQDKTPYDFVHIQVNNAFERLTGLNNVAGEKISDVLPGIHESNPELLRMFSRVLSTGNPERLESFSASFGGWLNISAYSHEKNHFIAVVDNITGKKQADVDLQAALVKAHDGKERLEAIIASMGEMLSVIDTDYTILYQNRIMQDSRGDHLGEHCYRAYENDDHICEGCPLTKTFKDGGTHKALRNPTSDTGPQQVEISVSPLRDIDGNIVAGIKVARDLTEYKKIEAQLRHAQKMEAIGTLAGGIAHDFNNILNVVLGYGACVMDTLKDGGSAKEDMNEVLTAANRAVDLTKRLLLFSRRQAVEVKPVNLNTLVSDLQKMLRQIARESTDFNLNLAEQPPIVLADAGQIVQVLINLATNARDAMPDGGQLTISTGREEIDEDYITAYGYGQPGMYASITVADTGQGIDAETQKKIFDPFFTTKGIGEGTGLGLAISYGILKQHHGYIKVYSEPGQGSVFKIYLPLSEEAILSENAAMVAVSVKGGNETILVAEDDASLRKFIRITLESFGYEVIAAKDGEDAMAKFIENSERIRLVLLDMVMPKKNGKEVGTAIRKINPGMKVMFTSGYPLDIVNTKEMPTGDFDFIYKPFPSRDILQKVREILDR